MDIANTKTSHLISTQLPFFIRNEHEKFVRFLEVYYEYLEQEDKVGNVLKNARKQYDIDLTEDEYADLMYATFMKFIPTSVIADRKILIKNIKDFYRAKGTEKATRFLFRILYNLEIEFYYPKLDVIRASDGKWYIQKSLRVTDLQINSTANTALVGLEKFIATRITANTSNASALVERVDRFFEAGLQIDELVLSGISGEFESGESIIAHFDENGEEKVITANIFGGIVNSITIDAAGTGYEVGDPVFILSSTGNGACAVVGSVSTGSIEDIGNFGGGAGYRVNNAIIITGGGGSGANGRVSTVILNEQYHPNSYNIVGSTLGLEGNTVIGNTTAFETFAYQNLATQWTNTSNLTVNTGAGTLVTTINLSHWKANSNVFFETYDYLNVNNTIVLVTSSNIESNVITVSPGLRGGLSQNSVVVIKKPNINSIVANSMGYWTFANTGPVGAAVVVNGGAGYSGSPEVSVVANNMIQQLGILGRMKIVDGGQGYNIGDEIEFINPVGSYGFGAKANVTGVDTSASNAISSVYWVQVPGFIIGGSGYNPDILPRANVISATGNGANIQVTALLGSGADLRPIASTTGAILRILILNRGIGYTSNTTIDLSRSGDGTANATAQVVEGLFTYPGRYLNDDGHISSYNFLQDRDFYQSFSYVIRSSKSIAKYRKAVKDLIHPAGTKLWGEHLYINENTNDVAQGNVSAVQRSLTTTAMYTANANLKIYIPNHGLSKNANVTLEFISGNIANYANSVSTYTPNGIFMVKSVTNADHIVVYSSKYVSSTQNVITTINETLWRAVKFKEGGRSLFVAGQISDKVHELELSIPYDISSYRVKRESPTLTVSIGGVDFGANGTIMYTAEPSLNNVYQYGLSQAWNVNTATLQTTLNVLAHEPAVTDVRVHPNGNTLYIIGSTTDRISQFRLNQQWNIATANLETTYYVGGREATPTGIAFSNNGSKLYVIGTHKRTVLEYVLGTPWNVNTANYSTASINLQSRGIEPNVSGLDFSSDGKMLYITGHSQLHQLPLLQAWNVNTAFYETYSSGNVLIGRII